MNEVEKLYRLANIEPLGNTDLREMKILVDGKVFVEGKDLPNNYYNIYPPFTAEKQIELIKWLYQKYKNFQIFKVANRNEVGIRTIEDVYYAYGENLEDAIADFLNRNWQDLTEEERKQLKEILE